MESKNLSLAKNGPIYISMMFTNILRLTVKVGKKIEIY